MLGKLLDNARVRAALRGLWSIAKPLLGLLLAWAVVGVVVVAFIEVRCGADIAQAAKITPLGAPRPSAVAKIATDSGTYGRPAEDTYLSYPEWYIVWSYEEKASFQQLHLPSGFPYFGAIGQYWSGYCAVNRLVQGRFPFNAGDHIMLVVIGTSFTLEYALKGVYEKTIGRLSELTSGHAQVEEDQYAYRIARQYADFTLVRPFYEFSFFKALTGLWGGTPLWGSHPARKLERRLFLSFDYAAEAFYCELIELATQALYGRAGSDTYAWIENTPGNAFAENPRVRKVQSLRAAAYVVIIPRYQEFTPTALRLVRRGVRFREIAGNADEIVISGLVPKLAPYDPRPAQELFSSAVLTEPGMKRVVFRAPIGSLTSVLPRLTIQRISIEHLYDF